MTYILNELRRPARPGDWVWAAIFLAVVGLVVL